MTPVHLFGSYYYRVASAEEFGAFYTANMQAMFGASLQIPIEGYMTGAQLQRRKDFDEVISELFELRIFLLYNDEVIGWHIGRQGHRDACHMSNTAIRPDHRGKGIYTALLPQVLAIYQERGYAKVTSRHHASNNAVLVPKLKAGFCITGFEIDERYGLFVALTYIFDENRRQLYHFRTGYAKANEELRKHL